MKLFRKLLIATSAVMGIVACFAVTIVAAKVYRQLSLSDGTIEHSADWENLGVTHEFGFGHAVEAPGIARLAGIGDADDDEDAAARAAVIEEELCDASPEEWEIWKTELKGRSPEAVRDILSFRRSMGAAAPDSFKRYGEFELTAADAAPREPQRLPESARPPAPRASTEALGTIETAIEATIAAE